MRRVRKSNGGLSRKKSHQKLYGNNSTWLGYLLWHSCSFYLFVIVYPCQLLRLLKDGQQFFCMIFHFKYYFTDHKTEELRFFNYMYLIYIRCFLNHYSQFEYFSVLCHNLRMALKQLDCFSSNRMVLKRNVWTYFPFYFNSRKSLKLNSKKMW